MKNCIFLVATALFCCTTAQAGNSRRCPTNCCPTPTCCSTATGPTTKLWKGKDGVIRDTLTHWQALHRSVDAEHLETEVAEVKAELESTTVALNDTKTLLEGTQAELVAAKEAAANEKASFEARIAALEKQLGEQTAVATKQKQRADKAETARDENLAEVKKAQTLLTGFQKQSEEEAAKMKVANDKLTMELAAMAAEKESATAAVSKALAEIEKMKQEAIESKKTEVAKKEEKDYENDPPKKDDEKAEEPKAEDAPANEEKADETAK